MAAIAKWYSDLDGTLTSGGSGGAYTLTTNQVHASLADQSMLVFRANHASEDNHTLNVDSLGAKTMIGPEIITNQIVVVVYNATNDEYEIISQTAPANEDGAKGWVLANNSGTVNASFNVTSVTDNGTGDFTVNWATDFSSAAYCAVGSPVSTSALASRINTLAAGTTQFVTYNMSGVSTDPDQFCVSAFGAQ